MMKYKVLTSPEAAGTVEVIANGYYGAVTIPETVDNGGVTYTVTSIGDYAFNDCKSLASISVPGNLTSIGTSAFENCTSLANISIWE